MRNEILELLNTQKKFDKSLDKYENALEEFIMDDIEIEVSFFT